MSRSRHPNKSIERVVKYAESLGWRVEMSRGHAWGHLLCPERTRDGCLVGVYSTPRNPENHARHIRRDIDLCPHMEKIGDAGKLEDEENGTEEVV